jgi:hypothetical protein
MGSRPCPYFDAGFRDGYFLCGPSEVCVSAACGECMAQCRPIPTECVDTPSCACAGPEVCGERDLPHPDGGLPDGGLPDGGLPDIGPDPRCVDEPGCADGAFDCGCNFF